MAVVKNMMVRAGADFSAITTQSKKASGSMQTMASSVSKSCSAIKRALSAVGIGVSIAAIVAAGKAAVEAYDEQAKAEMKLARIMRNTMHASNGEIQSILDLAEAQQELGVIGDEVTVAGAAQLAGYVKQSSSLQALIPLMNDMAAAQYDYEVSAEQATSVATMLGKAMNGQASVLTRQGYTLTAAQEQMLKYGNEEQRVAVLTEVVGARVGGMNAALAATPTGRMKQLNNTLSDIKEKFGQAIRTIGTVFLPLLNTVAKVLAAIATLFNKVAQTIANVFGGTVAGKEWEFLPSSTVGNLDDAADATDDLTDKTKEAAQAAKEANEEFQQASFDTLHILNENNKQSSASSGSDDSYTPPASDNAENFIRETDTGTTSSNETIGWLEKLLTKAKELWKDFKDSLDFTNLKEAFNKLKEAVQPLIGDLGKGLQWLYENVLKPLAQWTISELAPRVVTLLANAFKLLHAAIEALSPVLEAIWPILKWFAELAGFLITAALDELNHAIEMMTKAISGNLSDLERFQVLLQTLSAITLAGIIGGLGGLGTAAGAAATAASGLGTAIGFGAAAAGTGGLIAALTSGTTAVGGFAAGITGTAVPALTAGTAAAGTAAGGFAALAAPIAAIVAIIAALAIAIYEVVTHFDEVKDAANKAVDALKLAWNGIGEWFKTNVSEPIIQWGKEAWESIQKWGSEAAQVIRERWTGVKEQLVGMWQSVEAAGKSAWETVKQHAISAWSAVSSAWGRAKLFFEENVFQPLVESARSGVEKIKNIFSGVADAVSKAIASIKEGIRKAVSIADQLPSGWSLKNLTVTALIDKIKSINIPGLAEGAVIPPNRQFTAILGDQTSGFNIETPERLLRQIMRDELSAVAAGRTGSPSELMSGAIREGGSTARVIRMLDKILDAIEDGQSLTVDGYAIGRTTRRSMAMQARASG